MSRIYWHSEERTAAVRGSERFHAGALCSGLLYIALQGHHSVPNNPLRRVVFGYMRNIPDEAFPSTLAAYCNGLTDSYLLYEGRDYDVFTVALNTALVIGSDAIRLMARLHGQCEAHAYVEGANREWLADIIEQGQHAGIMRSDQGWEDVIALLRETDAAPVVTSYSVCEAFPNAYVGNYEPPTDEHGNPDDDAWYNLPSGRQWSIAMTGLRQSSAARTFGLEMKPDNWNSYYFENGVTGFMVRAYADSLASND
jgi:hypothetical protein